MKIIILVTADYAAVEPLTNKLNILGIFRNIAASSFPIRHRRMYLVVKVAGKVGGSLDPNTLSVSIASESGEELTRIESSFQLTRSSTGIPPEHNALFELNGLVFEEPGDYFFKVSINKGEAEEVAVVQVLESEA